MNKKQLLNALFHMEHLRAELLDALVKIEKNEQYRMEKPPIYPKSSAEPIVINSYPVFRFSYEGRLPTYYEDQNYRSKVAAYDWSKVPEGIFLWRKRGKHSSAIHWKPKWKPSASRLEEGLSYRSICERLEIRSKSPEMPGFKSISWKSIVSTRITGITE